MQEENGGAFHARPFFHFQFSIFNFQFLDDFSASEVAKDLGGVR
jgi:hypothetical protein